MKIYNIFKMKLGGKQVETKTKLCPGYKYHWTGGQEFIAALLWFWIDCICK